MASEIRLGQLIAPFGPGSIYTDKNGVPNIICGLDFWYKKSSDRVQWQVGEEALRKHVIDEPRLSALLDVPHFRQPPQYCVDEQNPDLSHLEVQTHRFPTWYVNSVTKKLRRFNLNTEKLALLEKGKGRWRPVRFISVCAHGHIADFPWKHWCGCVCPSDEGLVLNDSGGPDLRSLKVTCQTCKKSQTLGGAMFMERDTATDKITASGLARAGIDCGGERPWLGRATEACDEHPVAVLINQSNIYFGKTISSIYLPDLASEREIVDMQEILGQQDLDLSGVKVFLKIGLRSDALQKLRAILQPHYTTLPDDDSIMKAFEALGRGDKASSTTSQPMMEDSKSLAFRRAEYNVIRQEVGPGKSSELRVMPSRIPPAFTSWLSAVNLVERLRETRVFYGFERLVRSKNPLGDIPSAMRQLFLHTPEPEYQWLPAIKNYGEGLFVELREEEIGGWLDKNSAWLQDRLDQEFVDRMANETWLLPPHQSRCMWQWAARYLLVHTLAHILINQLVFECGYSSASLKERIFVSNDEGAPMAAFLIYTAAGDSEGSLGGLVRLGRPEMFEPMVRRAVSRASWCSADPVCSEDLGGNGSRRVNKAACHACVLLPETACETINSGLDRAMIVGTPQAPQAGFLSDLIQGFAI
ncbi:DrmB family protein [Pseudomonas sp. P5_A2_2]